MMLAAVQCALHTCYLLPYIGSSKELRPSPPAQRGLSCGAWAPADVIICRADYTISHAIHDKISLFCDVEPRAVIPLVRRLINL
jgi:CTP synthase